MNILYEKRVAADTFVKHALLHAIEIMRETLPSDQEDFLKKVLQKNSPQDMTEKELKDLYNLLDRTLTKNAKKATADGDGRQVPRQETKILKEGPSTNESQ